MRRRFLASIGSFGIAIILAWLAPEPIAGQGSGSQKKWTPPRTSWGDPDIQGQWNSQTSTPLERPQSGELAKKEALSDEEAESLEEVHAGRDQALGGGLDLGVGHGGEGGEVEGGIGGGASRRGDGGGR